MAKFKDDEVTYEDNTNHTMMRSIMDTNLDITPTTKVSNSTQITSNDKS